MRQILRFLLLALLACAACARAAAPSGNLAIGSRYWIDPTGQATVEQVAARDAAALEPLARPRAMALGGGTLWMRLVLPEREASRRWYLMLSGAAFFNRASLYLPEIDGRWREQRAGDRLPVSQWSVPHHAPLFEVPAGAAREVWLRLENTPAPVSPFVELLDEHGLQHSRQWTYLLLGGYLGFGLLVCVVALIHVRLYGDRAFVAYLAYVGCMMAFQLSFTGLGGLFLWPDQARFNDAAPPLFMLWMAGAGIWFIREATALARHSLVVDRAAIGFSVFGLLFPAVYIASNGPFVYGVLNVYGLLSVVMSISLCAWTWRRGEAYSGWLLLGFLPLHLAYPFPALRAAGVLPDGWVTQYAVLIGSAIEIPLLLYILHRRARDFSENRARLQTLDSTDPLTGLVIPVVLRLRLRDALNRARQLGHRCAVLVVDVSNHAEIAARDGRVAADRALVVAAARMSSLVRDVDTVCRIADTRFAILTEGPQLDQDRRTLAQHIVARGLERMPQLPPDVSLRLRVVTATAPGAIHLSAAEPADEEAVLRGLNRQLDRLLTDPKRVIRHLEKPGDEAPDSSGP